MEKVEITQEQYDRMKIIQLELLQEVDRLCSKYKIHYCLGYGTMLGAVRHKGFIPWDDDADVLMLREDYDRFKQVCKEELQEKFFFQDAETDSEYLWGYAKLRNMNTKYIRCGQEHILCKTGVFIDIFPLDYIPKTLVGQIAQDIYCTLLRKVLWAKVGSVCEKNILKKRIFCLLAHIPKEVVYRRLRKVIDAGKKRHAPRVRCLLFTAPGKHGNKSGNPIKTRYGFDIRWIIEREKVEFEGRMFWGTKLYQPCLEYLYGDYMKMPPQSERIGHAPVSEIDLGNEGMADDTEYWNSFYAKGIVEEEPTLFAQYVKEHLKAGGKIIDLGCGNGRDSVFFSKSGMEVYAVDGSVIATKQLEQKYGNEIKIINDDFVKRLGRYEEEFDYLYSRFTLHAIREECQTEMIQNAWYALKEGGSFFIEVRCKADNLYGKGELVAKDTYFYNGHRRRFLDKDELEVELKNAGFLIENSRQDRGFAPYHGVDPIVLRIVAVKGKNNYGDNANDRNG